MGDHTSPAKDGISARQGAPLQNSSAPNPLPTGDHKGRPYVFFTNIFLILCKLNSSTPNIPWGRVSMRTIKVKE